MQRAQQARHELEEHQRRLADEVDRAVAQTRPSLWLKPWDPGYESATAIALQQAAEASSGRRRYGDFGEWSRGWTRSGGKPTPAAVSLRASPVGPTAARKKPQTLVEYSRAMTPEEVAAMTPRERDDGVVG
jgi:hypothetical protein